MNLYKVLSTIPDKRSVHGKRYDLALILSIVLFATISGYIGARAIDDFVNKNKQRLIKYFELERKTLPARKTIFAAIRILDFNDLMKAFSLWCNSYVQISDNEWLSVDGKAIRGTITNQFNKYQSFVSMVSIFSQKKKQVITSKNLFNKKQSELKSFEDILDDLQLDKKAIFTLDALYCQKKTLSNIKGKGHDYVVGVKGNQPKLLKNIKKLSNSKIH